MPSEKRARQRAMRQVKMAEVERKRRRARSLRRGGLVIVVIAAVIGLVVLLSRGSGKSTSAAKSTHKAAATATTTTTTPASLASAPVCPPAAGAKKRVTLFSKAPPMCIAATSTFDATFHTDVGNFVVKLPTASSPAAVNNFVFLARYHFYDGTIFHRVIPGFVVQGGSPNGAGNGTPGYSFTGNTPPPSCKAAKDCYPVGGVALANSTGPSSDGSQFFIVLPGGQNTLDQEPNYTLFGTVVSGMPVVERIGADGTAEGTPKVTHHLISVTVTQVAS